mmetsp:Transcript_28385/g.31398  ORF Transcript_28385/g.31398 Transcript_28385/m.31398 type:complete len:303 (+) Transcript_28385:49-957(+)
MNYAEQELGPFGPKHCHKQEIVATLDLHGFRRDRAIREVTDFLDRVSKSVDEQCWVIIITGSGAHSHGEGPILRTAVQVLLQKREMTFFLNRGRGSFTVDAKSGLILYKKVREEDTKVQVVKGTEGGIIHNPRSVVAATNQSRVFQLKHLLPNYSITQDSKEEFRRLKYNHNKLRRKEQMELKRAVSDSHTEYQKDAIIRKQDDGQLSEILELSEQDYQQAISKEEELMQKVILLSRNCNKEKPDPDFQEALRRSQEEQSNENFSSDLKKALQLSKEEQNQENDILQEIIDLSLQDMNLGDE